VVIKDIKEIIEIIENNIVRKLIIMNGT